MSISFFRRRAKSRCADTTHPFVASNPLSAVGTMAGPLVWLLLLLPVLAVAGGCVQTTKASSSTPWPSFQSSLQPAISKSAVKAVLPDDVRIEPPDGTVPKELAAFSGIWHGWMCRDWTCDTKLAVERLDAKGGTIVYTVASESRAPYSERMEATFVDGELTGTSTRNFTITYRIRPDGNLDAYWRRGEDWASGLLTRQ